jgi:putative FmdB family regulatory protein
VPTYSYQCTECDDRFDIVQAFTDDALTTCNRCAGRLRKRFNSVGVVFKGSGFYRTDSRESGKKASSPSNGSSSSDSSSTATSEKSGSGNSEKSSPSSSDKSSSSSTTSTAAASN